MQIRQDLNQIDGIKRGKRVVVENLNPFKRVILQGMQSKIGDTVKVFRPFTYKNTVINSIDVDFLTLEEVKTLLKGGYKNVE
jgi:hypothetical protein